MVFANVAPNEELPATDCPGPQPACLGWASPKCCLLFLRAKLHSGLKSGVGTGGVGWICMGLHHSNLSLLCAYLSSWLCDKPSCGGQCPLAGRSMQRKNIRATGWLPTCHWWRRRQPRPSRLRAEFPPGAHRHLGNTKWVTEATVLQNMTFLRGDLCQSRKVSMQLGSGTGTCCPRYCGKLGQKDWLTLWPEHSKLEPVSKSVLQCKYSLFFTVYEKAN